MNKLKSENSTPSEPQGMLPHDRDRALMLTIGGLALIGLAVALIIFGGSLFDSGGENDTVVLPQIPSLSGESPSDAGSGSPPVVGNRALDFTLFDLEGNKVALADFANRPVVINFWATWCAPCRLEMPELEEAYEANRDQGLVVLAVNQQERETQVQSFFDELGFTFTPLLDSDGQVGRAYGVNGLPATVFVNSSGDVTAVHRGILAKSQLQDYLSATLE